MNHKFGLFVFAKVEIGGPGGPSSDDEHLEGFDEYSHNPKHLIHMANSMIEDFKAEDFKGTFSFEIWVEDENGEYGMEGDAYWKKEITIK